MVYNPEYQKKYREKNKDKQKQYQKQYYEEHKDELKLYREEHKDEIAVRQKKYRKEHKIEKIKYDKQYYEEHKDELVVKRQKYREVNPIRSWASSTLTSHRRTGFIVDIVRDELISLAERIEYCPICGVKFDWCGNKGRTLSNSPSLDRLNNGKELNIGNIDIICYRCNVSKRDRTLDELVIWNQQCIDYVKRVKLERGL
jgi:hypothetical protein